MSNQPFKYTIASIQMIVDDVKKINLWIKIISCVVSVAYFIFAIVTRIGNFYANIILASLFTLYTIFDLVTLKKKKEHKQLRKGVRRVYVALKLMVKEGVLVATIYGFYTATTAVSPISIIITTLMILLWILQFVFEIVTFVIERRLTILYDSIRQDVGDTLKPVNNVVNFFRKIGGKEEKKPKEKSKLFYKFKEKVDETIEQRKEQKNNKNTLAVENKGEPKQIENKKKKRD